MTTPVAGSGLVEKPWGHELRWAITDRYLGKVLLVRAGHCLSLQYHVRKEETIYVNRGLLELELEDESGRMTQRCLEPGQSAHIPPGRRHRFRALEETEIFEVSSPEIDDVVRLEDAYGRAGTAEG